MQHIDSPVLGWREWVTLPDHRVPWMKAKVDTGARTSSLHAFALEPFRRGGEDWVRFEIHPWQRSGRDAVLVELPVADRREIRSSSGETELRHVVLLPVRVAGLTEVLEVTLARRDEMGFRMLLGRQALRKRFLVDPARSYLGGKPAKAIRQANRAKPDDDKDPR